MKMKDFVKYVMIKKHVTPINNVGIFVFVNSIPNYSCARYATQKVSSFAYFSAESANDLFQGSSKLFLENLSLYLHIQCKHNLCSSRIVELMKQREFICVMKIK